MLSRTSSGQVHPRVERMKVRRRAVCTVVTARLYLDRPPTRPRKFGIRNSEFGIATHPPTEEPQIAQMDADLGIPAHPLQARRLHHKRGLRLLWQHASRVQGGWVAFSGGAWHPDSSRVGVPGILSGSSSKDVPPRSRRNLPGARVGGWISCLLSRIWVGGRIRLHWVRELHRQQRVSRTSPLRGRSIRLGLVGLCA
jgi:hypothetical protein